MSPFSTQTRSAEGSEDDGLGESLHLLHHSAGTGPTGRWQPLYCGIFYFTPCFLPSYKNNTVYSFEHQCELGWVAEALYSRTGSSSSAGAPPPSLLCPPSPLHPHWHRSGAFSVFRGLPFIIWAPKQMLGTEHSPRRICWQKWGSAISLILGHYQVKGGRGEVFLKHNSSSKLVTVILLLSAALLLQSHRIFAPTLMGGN